MGNKQLFILNFNHQRIVIQLLIVIKKIFTFFFFITNI